MNRLKFIVLFLLFSQFAFAQMPVLKLNLTNTSSLVYRFEQEHIIEQEVMGNLQKISKQIQIDYKIIKEKSSDSIYGLRVQFERIKLNIDNGTSQPDESLFFDSDSSTNKPGNLSHLNLLIGKSYLVNVNSKAEIQTVEYMDDLIDWVMNETRNDSIDQVELFSGFLFPKQAGNIFNQIFINYPETLSESWKTTYWSDLIQKDSVAYYWSYHHADQPESDGNIQITGNAQREIEQFHTQTDNYPAVFDMAENISSSYNIKAATGLPYQVEITELMAGMLEMDLTSEGLDKISWPMRISVFTHWKLLKQD